jgi:hypothetical protein
MALHKIGAQAAADRGSDQLWRLVAEPEVAAHDVALNRQPEAKSRHRRRIGETMIPPASRSKVNWFTLAAQSESFREVAERRARTKNCGRLR